MCSLIHFPISLSILRTPLKKPSIVMWPMSSIYGLKYFSLIFSKPCLIASHNFEQNEATSETVAPTAAPSNSKAFESNSPHLMPLTSFSRLSQRSSPSLPQSIFSTKPSKRSNAPERTSPMHEAAFSTTPTQSIP